MDERSRLFALDLRCTNIRVANTFADLFMYTTLQLLWFIRGGWFLSLICTFNSVRLVSQYVSMFSALKLVLLVVFDSFCLIFLLFFSFLWFHFSLSLYNRKNSFFKLYFCLFFFPFSVVSIRCIVLFSSSFVLCCYLLCTRHRMNDE